MTPKKISIIRKKKELMQFPLPPDRRRRSLPEATRRQSPNPFPRRSSAKPTVYLAGPMQHAIDNGMVWRREITPLLEQRGIEVLDPTLNHYETNLEERRSWMFAGKFDKLAAHMREVRRTDLEMVDRADFLIACLNAKIYSCGTFEEIFTAIGSGKPVFVCEVHGKSWIPEWLFGALPESHLFGSMDEVLLYIDKWV